MDLRATSKPTSKEQAVIVVGAGQAGAEFCWSLRQGGFPGKIIWFGREPSAPYERPPLSKKFLEGSLDRERLFLRGASAYESAGITCLFGRSVAALALDRQTVIPETGSEIRFDKLVLATGARARRLPLEGDGLEGVRVLRDVDDAISLRRGLGPGRRLVVIGGGYLGLEVAATAVKLGAAVTVVESADNLMSRGLSPATSAFFGNTHRAHGVTVHLGESAVHLEDDGRGHVRGVALASGTFVPADVVLAAIGSVPDMELARAAGLDCRDGIVVDHACRTSHPNIFAIGDCATEHHPDSGRHVRLESVHGGVAQARRAAAAIMGKPRPAERAPYFWSEQYGLKLQIVGCVDPRRNSEDIVRGDPSRSFAVYRLQDGVVASVEAVDSPLDFIRGQKLLGQAFVDAPAA